MTIYITPVCFTITILLCAMAVFKFQFLNVTPIALQRIVDRISDGYVVLDEDNVITDFNETFLAFNSLKASDIRNVSIFDWQGSKYLPSLEDVIQKASVSAKTYSFEAYIPPINKYFNVEISSIVNKNNLYAINKLSLQKL